MYHIKLILHESMHVDIIKEESQGYMKAKEKFVKTAFSTKKLVFVRSL